LNAVGWFCIRHDFSRAEKMKREWGFRPVTFKDGRSVVSRVAVDGVPVCFCSPARGGRCWVSAGGLRLLEGVAGLLVILGRALCLICRWNTLPCGYVMGVHGALVAGIPGLKGETWGTHRVFPTGRI
jgi:hypothetical protein